jgi:DNA-binding transcriptional LysR family regulator
MELRQLEYFVAVVEEANFTRAAARVHVAQPGVSAQIRRLERELGQDLLDRAGRTVTLTEAGALVLPWARAALAAVAGARLAIDELVGLHRGRVAIGMITSVPSEVLDLPLLLAAFHTDHPAVDISLTVATTDELVEALQAGRIDIAVVAVGTGMPDGIGIEVITSEPFVAVVAHTDGLAKRRSITLRGLAGHQLISLPKGAGMRSSIDAAFHAAAMAPRISFEAGDPRLVAELAATGLGVGIVPKSVADARRAILHTIAITGPAMHGEIALAWRDAGPISPATRTLVKRLRDAVVAQHREATS